MRRAVLVWSLVILGLLLMAGPAYAVKAGVLLGSERPMEYARRILAGIWASRGYTLTVTSGFEGAHIEGSLHYQGLAEDYRRYDVRPDDLPGMLAEARTRLGSDYDVILESDHIHVEYDPKVRV
jgi:hypothetical protein